jgi:hypothetical protein
LISVLRYFLSTALPKEPVPPVMSNLFSFICFHLPFFIKVNILSVCILSIFIFKNIFFSPIGNIYTISYLISKNFFICQIYSFFPIFFYFKINSLYSSAYQANSKQWWVYQ